MPSRNSRSVKKIQQAIPEEELEDIPEDEPDGVDPDDDDTGDGDYVADAEQGDSESDDPEAGVSDIIIDWWTFKFKPGITTQMCTCSRIVALHLSHETRLVSRVSHNTSQLSRTLLCTGSVTTTYTGVPRKI